MPVKTIELGTTFGDWTVLDEGRRGKHKFWYFLCRCVCGTERLVPGGSLRNGHSGGCGCRRYAKVSQRNSQHGHCPIAHRTPTYTSWQHAKTRCLNPRNGEFHRYGGRGIRMCKAWLHSFEAFLRDMGERPSLQHSLDRIDSNGHYEPANCRWATQWEQHNNVRSNHPLTHDGETHTIAEWARLKDMNYNTLNERIRSGWSVRDALTLPCLRRPGRRLQRRSPSLKTT